MKANFSYTVVLKPQILTPVNHGRRWLEVSEQQPRTKQFLRRVRLTLLDGVLAAGRALTTSRCGAIVAFGEGAIVAMALMSAELRAAAVKERHADENDVWTIGLAMEQLQYIILIAPHSFPMNRYMQMLRDAVPEMASINHATAAQVLVVIPTRDPLSKMCTEQSQLVLGAATEAIAFW
mgnify:CR=1 FL=1